MTKVVIVGAGFGGLEAARALAKAKDVSITIIDRSNHHLFQPLLYQVAVAGLNPSEIASPVRSILKAQKNCSVLMGSVTAIDRKGRQVIVDDGAIALDYDYLILAVGGKTSYFGHDEWSEVAPGLKSLNDALTIRSRVLYAFERAEKTEDEEERKRLMTLIVIGGGPTGVEMAGALTELTQRVIRWDFRRIKPEQARVILIDAGKRLLAAFPETLSEYTLKRLTAMGVQVRLGEQVKELEAGRLVSVKGEEHTTWEAETVIWAAGVGGNPLAGMLECELDRAGRVTINSDLRIPGDERVFCIGDMAHFEHPNSNNGKPMPGVAQVAMQMGTRAAKNLLAHRAGQPLKEFNYFDKGNMATIGRTAAVASSFGMNIKGFPAWLAWLFIHVMYLVGFQNRLLVLMRWMWGYFTWKWGARLITKNPRILTEPHKEESTKDGPLPSPPAVGGLAPSGSAADSSESGKTGAGSSH